MTETEAWLAPLPKPEARLRPGEFCFSVIGLAHGHIYGMTQGLLEAGATLKQVFDPDAALTAAFIRAFPQATPARDAEEILSDPAVRLIAGAAIPCDRAALGIAAMEAGKDYFTDKPPFTSQEQLCLTEQIVRKTGRKYFCYFSERLHSESAEYAGQLIGRGAIGKVISVTGFGPHRLSPETRAPWFFRKEKTGGILCDIGSHQIEQFLAYTGNQNATVTAAAVKNVCHPAYPGLQDYGECSLTGEDGANFYFRTDWLTPDGLRTWGDGRTFILGTEGSIEIRKYIELCETPLTTDMVYLVNGQGEFRLDACGRTGFPFFSRLLTDCMERTETAMTQAHIFLAARLAMTAQAMADAKNATP